MKFVSIDMNGPKAVIRNRKMLARLSGSRHKCDIMKRDHSISKGTGGIEDRIGQGLRLGRCRFLQNDEAAN